MFFPESDPPLEMAQLESHPVFAKLKTIEKENGLARGLNYHPLKRYNYVFLVLLAFKPLQ